MTRTEMETRSGAYFDFANPSATDIDVEDIAHSLSKTCRFGGHCEPFVSVAEHAMLVRYLVRDAGHPELSAAALHHDSHEAFVGDVPTPLKCLFGKSYRALIERIDGAIGEALEICPEAFCDPVVKEADRLATSIEAVHVKLSGRALPYEEPRQLPDWFRPGLSPSAAAELFLYFDAKDRV